MFKVVLALFMLFAVTRCTAVCEVSKAASTIVATQVATQLNCAKLDAVKASVDEQVSKLKLCEKKGASGASFICAPIINALIGGGVAQLPAT